MLTVIKGGRVIDPGNLDGIMDIFIKDDKIVEIKTDGFRWAYIEDPNGIWIELF